MYQRDTKGSGRLHIYCNYAKGQLVLSGNNYISKSLQSLPSYWNTFLRISQVLSKSRVVSLSLTLIWPTPIGVFDSSSRTRRTINIPDKSQDIRIAVNIKSPLHVKNHAFTLLDNTVKLDDSKFSVCFPFMPFDRECEKLLNKLQSIKCS